MQNNTDITARINALKKEKNAVILVHNYQLGEVQDIGDFVGDSLELAQKAAATGAKLIVFCGVHFMAETAAIIAPGSKVILPDSHAGCPMADMIDAAGLRRMKDELPGRPVVCYVNSTAEVKAESDICCTSANAVKVVSSLPDDEIIFVPDQYLGYYVQQQTGKHIHFWPGYCPTHARILPEHILELKSEHPNAPAVVHPECRPEVTAVADEVLSTGGMIRFAQRPEISELIVGTEMGIIHRLRKENPGKRFYPVSEQAVCPNMKLITLDKILTALETESHAVSVTEEIADRARLTIERMLAIKA
ncbi:MAG: quinolinate synthase NadA [Dehalogenimonas sp.]|uniref:Quinolinate synthase n=1 Tax=Candidatus Dehalogenimonas loeffleri TaxID=3127115 RepID=A0ABZ2J1J6_9CHLR|nr:quinolinate synthase NadA [Dehalogenimonas sp.]